LRLKDCFEQGLLKRVKLPDEVVLKEIENAKRHLDNASFCFNGKKYDLAVVSIYTSMFHAARAVLFSDSIKERSHICIIIYLREKHPELSEYITVLDNYRRSRHGMLYGIDTVASEEDAELGIEKAGEFIGVVEKKLK
jgi:uncharacterized protein (UPF0332 family)